MARIPNHRVLVLESTAKAVGRVGALAAALGVGSVLGGMAVAGAEPDRTATEAPSAAGDEQSPARSTGGDRQRSALGDARSAIPNPERISNSERTSGSERISNSERRVPTPAGPSDRAAVIAPRSHAAPALPAPAAAVRPATAVGAPAPSGRGLAVPAPVASTPRAVTAAPAPATWSATPAPVAPTASARRVSAARVLLDAVSPAGGSRTGAPTESPASWAALAVASRLSRPTSRRTTTATNSLNAATAIAGGTTTRITWAWGTNTAIPFNPTTDKLDFGWMGATNFDVTEQSGSTRIAIVGNNQTYTLSNVALRQLQMSNIIAQDPGARTKWQNLISAAGQSVSTPPTVSIANASVAEGNSGSTNLAFTVTLSKASDQTVTVNYATANGTATAGQDYTAGSGTVTFAPGVLSQQVKVVVAGDTAVESDETLSVSLSAPANATLATAVATGTITNDDTAVVVTPPTVSIANASVPEGNSGSANLAFTATLSKASDKTVTVNYATSNGTATAGQDYTATSGTISFAPGVTSQQVAVAVSGDATVETAETLTVTLSSPTNATLATATATGTIANDDAAAPVPGQAQWGASFFAPYVDMAGWPVPDLLKISQTTGASLMTAAFLQATPDGKLGWAGLAALTPGGTGEQAQTIDASIRAFKAAGGDVMISMGGAAGTSLAQSYSARGWSAQALADAYAGVIDTYGVSQIDFDIEGAAVADQASIALNSQALTLLQQSKPDVKIWYTLPVLPTGLTADGVNVVESALKAGVDLAGVNVMAMDFGESAAPTTGTNAQTMGTYAIRSAEGTHAQLGSLYGKYGKTFDYSQLGVTPMIGVNDVTTEVFTVADAQALEDYARAKGLGMLGFWSVTRDTPGSLGQATPIASGVSSPAGSFSAIFNDYGTVNVVDYGSAPGGGTTTPVQGGTTTVIAWRWGTDTVLAFDTAKDKLDFGWFQPGNFEISEASGSTRIAIVGNSQTYTLSNVKLGSMSMGNIVALDSGTLTKWQNAIAAAGQTTTVITPPTVSVANATVAEGNSGNTELAFTVTLSKASTTAVTVNYATANGTATAGQDYTATAGTITFAPGVLSQQVKVAVAGDTAVESDESLTVTLSTPAGATLGTATATGFVTNDDTTAVVTAPTVSIANASVAEGNSGATALTFTVSLSKASTTAVSVNFATASGTATAGQDYTATSGTVSFAPGVLSQQVTVSVAGDSTPESAETVTVTLSNPTGATLGTAAAIGTITDDDTTTVTPPVTALPIATTDKVIAAYFPEWGIYGRNFQVADIPGDQVNHVIYSFLNLTSSGEVAIYDSFAATQKRFAANETVNGEADLWYYPASDPRSTQTVWGNFNQLAELKSKYPHMRVSIAIGGWTLSSNFSTVASTAAGRETMANSIVNFLTTYQMFDGIDFDWEYPGGGGLAGNSENPDDGANYAELLKVVRAKLDVLEAETGRTYDISVASPAGYDKIANFNLAGLAPYVDFFNVMSYDFHGTWENTTGHQSAFTGDPNGYDIQTAIGLYLAAGVDPAKIVLGAPLYTRGWSGVADGGDGGYLEQAAGAAPGTFEAGVYDYKDLLAQLKDPASGWKLYWDDKAQAAYLYNASEGLFSSFETPTSIAQKAQWADDLGLGGMMFWDITNDAVGSPESLVRAAYSSLVLGSDLNAVRSGSTLTDEVIVGGDGVITALPGSVSL